MAVFSFQWASILAGGAALAWRKSLRPRAGRCRCPEDSSRQREIHPPTSVRKFTLRARRRLPQRGRSMQTRVISHTKGSMMEFVHWLGIGAATAVVAIAWLRRRHRTRPKARRPRSARRCSPTTARGTVFARLSTTIR
jgi:hypothetical protein